MRLLINSILVGCMVLLAGCAARQQAITPTSISHPTIRSGSYGLSSSRLSTTGWPPKYSIVDLGYYFGPLGINRMREVVGDYLGGGEYTTAVLYKQGVVYKLGQLPGDILSDANAINDRGVAVGDSGGSNSLTAVEFVIGGSPFSLGIPSGYATSTAVAVNNAGEIIGYSLKNTCHQREPWPTSTTVFDGAGHAEVLRVASTASGVNNIGEVSISFQKRVTQCASNKEFAGTDPGGALPLPANAVYGTSRTAGINDEGSVIGTYTGITAKGHSYTTGLYWHDGTVHVLEPPGPFNINNTVLPYAINDSNWLVGNYISAKTRGQYGSFLWRDGSSFVDLSDLLPANSGWKLIGPSAINVNGDIVGDGELNGSPHGFMLVREK